MFVLSVKDKDAFNELLAFCRSGKIVESLLKKCDRKHKLLSGKRSCFRMTLSAVQDGKSGTNCTHLYTPF